MGETQIRFCSSIPLIFKGVNNLGIGLPDGWGMIALPAAGSCLGVKKVQFSAGSFSIGAEHLLFFSRAGVPVRETVIPW
jgi:hypothetical protein